MERRGSTPARRHHHRSRAARRARARRPRLRPRRRRRVARVGTDRRSGRRAHRRRRPFRRRVARGRDRRRRGPVAGTTRSPRRQHRDRARRRRVRRPARMARPRRRARPRDGAPARPRSSRSSSWTCNRPTLPRGPRSPRGPAPSSTATSAARAAVRRGPTPSSRRHARCGPSSTASARSTCSKHPSTWPGSDAPSSAPSTPLPRAPAASAPACSSGRSAMPTPVTSTSSTCSARSRAHSRRAAARTRCSPTATVTACAGLVQHRERRDEERHEYLAALASAPERIICFARADSRAQRRLLPSRWLLETARALHGSELSAEGLRAAVEPQRWLEVVESFEHGVGGDAEPGSPVEYDLRSLLSWLDKGRSVGRHPLATGELGAGFDAVFARASRGVHPLRRLRRGPGRGRRRRPHRLPDVARDVGDVPVPVPARQRPAHPRGAASREDGDDQRARRGLTRARDPRGVPPRRAAAHRA